MRLRALIILSAILISTNACRLLAGESHNYDVIIYGGTSSAVTAAVQVKKMGRSVIIVSPSEHLGGLSTGGLGFTDTGNKSVIGGLSREFYSRLYKYYQENPKAWKLETPENFATKNLGMRRTKGSEKATWSFEPHVAEAIFEDFIKENDIPVHRNQWLDRENGVVIENGKIKSFTTHSGNTYVGKIFLDTTYEGDLMASAGVSYHVGRESIKFYDEKWNGVQTGVLHHQHHFGDLKISPYKIPGKPESGVLARISTTKPGAKGSGDNGVQAYCFRMCLTNDPRNRLPFPKPKNYDPEQYELLLRIFHHMDPMYVFKKFDPVPNNKTDTNNHGPFSFDNIGMNYDYPEASYKRRKEIIQEHKTYQLGMLYFICHDPRVPKKLQNAMKEWGLPKDEFKDNGNWSHQLYVREARRMIGKYVIHETQLIEGQTIQKPIGMGSYGIDSHNIQRYITEEGYVQNEGDIGVKVKPYQISYDCIIPKAKECTNLIVPVCVSATHTAFGSIRMEPVFMILGHSAGAAAAIAAEENVNVQDVDYAKLKEVLIKSKQILQYKKKTPKK